MDKHLPLPPEPVPAARLSLAEEQQREFEKDQKAGRRPLLGLRLPGFIFRN